MTHGKGPAARSCRCGARLAQNNPGPLCASCGKQAHEATLQPPEVSWEFWRTDAMQDALASRHMGRVIRAWRHHPFHWRRRALAEQALNLGDESFVGPLAQRVRDLQAEIAARR